MKIYTVSLELAVVVMAETASEAKQLAKKHKAMEEDLNCNGYDWVELSAHQGAVCNCDPHDIIYHAGNYDLTLEQAEKLIKEQAPVGETNQETKS